MYQNAVLRGNGLITLPTLTETILYTAGRMDKGTNGRTDKLIPVYPETISFAG